MKKIAGILMVLVACSFSWQVNAQLSVGFYVDTNVVCYGVPVVFTDTSSSDTSFYSYNWTFGDGSSDTARNPVHVYDTTGYFTVKLQVRDDKNRVEQMVRFNLISVRDTPVADFIILDTLYADSYSVFVKCIPPDSLEHTIYWNFGDGETTVSESMHHTYSTEGEYDITMIVDAGKQCRDTITKSVKIEDAFEAPDVFTPNDDGTNDLFFINTNGYTVYRLSILNNWGQLIYAHEGKKVYWDGYNIAGERAQPGVYFYIVEPVDDSSSNQDHGYVHLYR
ncbi:MAG: hypothetical protein C0594_07950 [Marinilabiliales bacterium]|nr:MAG: hypothetical protein C0594_07950 [Marinilabiliales bacterium]